MDSERPSKRSTRRRGSGKAQHRGMYDKDLLAAKNRGSGVRIYLGLDTTLLEEGEDSFPCKVLEVDTYAIKVQSLHGLATETLWVNKAGILAVRIDL